VILATPTYDQLYIFFGLVSLKVNRHAKFEVYIFSRSKDIKGVPKFEK